MFYFPINTISKENLSISKRNIATYPRTIKELIENIKHKTI
jgi:hypothetical protein